MRGKNKLSLSRIGLRIRKERNKLLYQRGMQAPIKLVDKQDAPIRKHLKLSEIAYKWPDSQGLCPGITAGNSPVC